MDEGSCSGTEEAVDPCQGVANVDELQEKCALMDKCKIIMVNVPIFICQIEISLAINKK